MRTNRPDRLRCFSAEPTRANDEKRTRGPHALFPNLAIMRLAPAEHPQTPTTWPPIRSLVLRAGRVVRPPVGSIVQRWRRHLQGFTRTSRAPCEICSVQCLAM